MLLFWRHFREERCHEVLLQGGLYLLVKFGREGLPMLLFAAALRGIAVNKRERFKV